MQHQEDERHAVGDGVEGSIAESAASAEEESILQDVADYSGYHKSLKGARIWLYVITAMQVFFGIFEYIKYDMLSIELRWFTMGIDISIGLVFLACAVWSYKKPFAAFLTAIILYFIISLASVIMSPSSINFGIIVKVIVIIALYRAVKDAREMEDLKESFGKE